MSNPRWKRPPGDANPDGSIPNTCSARIPRRLGTLGLSRQDLAGLVGATTETVIRQLTDLRQREVVTTHGREIVVQDVARLTRIAHRH